MTLLLLLSSSAQGAYYQAMKNFYNKLDRSKLTRFLQAAAKILQFDTHIVCMAHTPLKVFAKMPHPPGQKNLQATTILKKARGWGDKPPLKKRWSNVAFDQLSPRLLAMTSIFFN